MNKSVVYTLAALLGIVCGAEAQETKAFQASLTPDIAVCDRNTRIEGVALSIWGENPQSAFALGFVNGSKGDSSGLSWGFFGNYAENYTGLQLGFVNYASASVHGVQWGFANIADEAVSGAQVGAVNYTQKLSGLQWGVVNYAKTAESGVQVGLVNLLPANETWFQKLPNEVAPGMIFVNWHF